MREFIPPPITTKDKVGEVGLDYAFQIELELEERHESRTARGTRIYQGIMGGRVRGAKLNGAVYTQGHGDYGLARDDGVVDLNTHFALNVDGEWIYVRHFGYERPDGYVRVSAYFDSDLRGKHAELNNSVFIATGEPSADGRRIVFTYYEAV
jgi:hypothetical protein